MTDGDESPAAICPWCSAVLPAPDVETCPSCKAALTTGTEQSLPGLTAIDAEAIIRAKTPSRQRSRLLSWFGGEEPDDSVSPAEAGAIAPPDPAVKREMLKLQIAADIANLQAEAVALQTDAALEGRVLDLPDAADIAAIGTGLDQSIDAAGAAFDADLAAAAVASEDAAAAETVDAAADVAETADAAAETVGDAVEGDTPA
jgi:hypothetical protein